jgi:hypothetical protein
MRSGYVVMHKPPLGQYRAPGNLVYWIEKATKICPSGDTLPPILPTPPPIRVNRAPVLTLRATVGAERLGEAGAAMEALAASLPPEELNRVGFRLYERFRPDMPEEAQGDEGRVAGGADCWGGGGICCSDNIVDSRPCDADWSRGNGCRIRSRRASAEWPNRAPFRWCRSGGCRSGADVHVHRPIGSVVPRHIDRWARTEDHSLLRGTGAEGWPDLTSPGGV